MEFNFNELKKKTVINVADGKKLGRVCDLTVSFPEGCFKSITVAPCFSFAQDKVVIENHAISQIGEDAILVKICESKPQQGCKARDFEEE